MDPFSVIPLTFHVKNKTELAQDGAFKAFKADFERRQDLEGELNVWIIKPGEQTNQGKSITVTDNFAQIEELVGSERRTSRKKVKAHYTWIIQKYLEKPMLFERRKFDIRCFFLLTVRGGRLKGYWYNEGYIRTSSQKYQCNDFGNRMIHLTNDAV